MFRRICRSRILVLGQADARQVVHRQLDLAQCVGLEIVERDAVDERSCLSLFNPDEVRTSGSKVTSLHSRIERPASPHAVDRVIFVR